MLVIDTKNVMRNGYEFNSRLLNFKGREKERNYKKKYQNTINKIALRMYLLITSLDGNGLNTPIKRHRVAEF